MEGPPIPERKERAYFEVEIVRLFEEAQASGEVDLVAILATMMGSIKAGKEHELAAMCRSFSSSKADQLEEAMVRRKRGAN